MRRCIREPIPEVYTAIDTLAAAVDAHFAGDTQGAEDLFRAANCPRTREWLFTTWTTPKANVIFQKPEGDAPIIPKAERDPAGQIVRPALRRQVLARDGHRCRYCGLPVVDAEVRKAARRLYPDAVPWPDVHIEKHAAFQASWLQYDHVEPYARGGRTSPDNIVVTCALCNFGKDRYTLRQLDIEDPRLRPPVPTDFDGLERLRAAVPPASGRKKRSTAKGLEAGMEAFFFPGARLSSGYVDVPAINGKRRWFKIGDDVEADAVERGGVAGCILRCHRYRLVDRELDPEAFLDRGEDSAQNDAPSVRDGEM